MWGYILDIFCKTQMRIADDRLVPGVRVASMCSMMDATDSPRCDAISRRAFINSCSNEMLVW